MIKKILLITSIFFYNCLFAQLLPEVNDLTGNNIAETKTIYPKSRFTSRHEITRKYSYLNSVLKNEKVFNKNKELENDFYFFYEQTDSTFQRLRIDSVPSEHNQVDFEKQYFNKDGLLYKIESTLNPDLKPEFCYENIKRDSINRIISFDYIFNNSDGTKTISASFNFYYNKINQIDSIIRSNPNSSSREKRTYTYYKNGLIKTRITESNSSGGYVGGRVWSRKERNKYGYLFKYDKNGNWVKRYYLSSWRKILNVKRKITYK